MKQEVLVVENGEGVATGYDLRQIWQLSTDIYPVDILQDAARARGLNPKKPLVEFVTGLNGSVRFSSGEERGYFDDLLNEICVGLMPEAEEEWDDNIVHPGRSVRLTPSEKKAVKDAVVHALAFARFFKPRWRAQSTRRNGNGNGKPESLLDDVPNPSGKEHPRHFKRGGLSRHERICKGVIRGLVCR